MIVVLLNVYLLLLFCLVKFGIIPFNLFWKISPILVLLLLLVGLFIPMNWGAPQGLALVVRNSIGIVPNVAGEVVDVPVAANAPLKAGDVLFRIDPVPYQSKVEALQAELKFQELRLAQTTQLETTGAGPAFDVQQRQAEVDDLRAQITNARWDLDKTTVRAPADGYVTNLALRKGARVSNLPLSPVMAFIDTSETIIGVEIPQIDARYIAPGQWVEATFKFAPGEVYTGKVESVLQAVASGQTQVSGAAVAPTAIKSVPFIVRVRLDDQDFANRLPAGATGAAAIFTDRVKPAHVIRRVLLRQIAITNYINPF
ncbi:MULTISPECIES: efflux RND transporter periplasmic adaptor subunit [unclassified Sinorhizobium]|uniref:HlyD family secretion protein n=1 Tax=unclassified Sinorhizobium TaxID=2613772 RepID=UPI0024C3AF79|nr:MULTISPECIES: efflux RND transporter periplasmic adaptor subunit [unclassified Sinorhizobium]MDK1373604.1 efflux RND transporter periplasmic adaptor subunit [Sinorhizobium sp. 6-70]MDK1482300.1 efflux RND transporter periplasmic adaptor subunit [Sinorhizobium sp. 6-117]